LERQLYLREFMPKSELVTEEHTVSVPKFPAIDMHCHYRHMFKEDGIFKDGMEPGECVRYFMEFGVERVINLDGYWGDRLDKIISAIHPFEDRIIIFGSVDTTRVGDKDFGKYVQKTIEESYRKGIKGLKFHKTVSLAEKDSSGKYIAIDDIRLKPIWEKAAELNLPVLIHIADPVAFFKPIDQYNERYEELIANPNWSFYKPGLYTREQLMQMQENLLADNPSTTFIIAHVGSYAENLGQVRRWLDNYPNMYVDVAARFNELGRQPYTARKFFIDFQARILFGTDERPMSNDYPVYYRFLETWDEYFDYSFDPVPYQGRWKIYGIGLEDTVLEKIYNRNAKKILRL